MDSKQIVETKSGNVFQVNHLRYPEPWSRSACHSMASLLPLRNLKPWETPQFWAEQFAGKTMEIKQNNQHGKHPALLIFSLDVFLSLAPPAYPKMKVLGTLDALSGSRWSFISPGVKCQKANGEILGKFNNHACNHQTCKLMWIDDVILIRIDWGVLLVLIRVPRAPNGGFTPFLRLLGASPQTFLVNVHKLCIPVVVNQWIQRIN